MSKASPDDTCTNCETCGREISRKGSLTQWIGLGEQCRCDIKDFQEKLPDLGSQQDNRKSCSQCGKPLSKSTGSLTQWIFKAETCCCRETAKVSLSAAPQSQDIALSEGCAQPGDEKEIPNAKKTPFPGSESSDARPGEFSPTFKKPGDTIARQYEVVELLGKGGASVVYCARHKILDKKFAVKVLLPDRIPDRKSINRFQQEAKSVSRLEHKNIVAVHEFGIDDDGQPFLVMDYIQGIALDKLIEKSGSLMPVRTAHMFLKIAEALEHAHKRSVIHRDLKPSNIIIENVNSESESPRIVDFGIAKLAESGQENKSLTQTGEIFGSPFYMSPEQCKGQSLDHRSDMYSLGCMMYEVLTGTLAAKSDGVLETLMLHVNGLSLNFEDQLPVILITQRAQQKKNKETKGQLQCLNGMEKIIHALTKVSPNERYQTAENLASDLRAVLSGKPPSGPKRDAISQARQALATTLSHKSQKNSQDPFGNKSLLWVGIAIISIVALPLCFVLLKDNSNVVRPQKFSDTANLPLVPEAAVMEKFQQKRRYPGNGIYTRTTAATTSKNVLTKRRTIQVTTRGGLRAPYSGTRVFLDKFDPEMFSKLEHLGCTDYSLKSQTVSDEELAALSKLKKISMLELQYSHGFTKKGISQLSRLSTLQSLFLDDTKLNDSWAQVISTLPVRTIALYDNRFSDLGVKKIIENKSIKYLGIEQKPNGHIPPALNNRDWKYLPQEDGYSSWYCRVR